MDSGPVICVFHFLCDLSAPAWRIGHTGHVHPAGAVVYHGNDLGYFRRILKCFYYGFSLDGQGNLHAYAGGADAQVP